MALRILNTKMPQLLLAALPAIIGGIGTTVGLVKGAGGGGQPQGPTPAQMALNAINQETATRNTATKEASQLLPQLQYETSGGLSPSAYQDLSANFSGNANFANSSQFKDMVARFLGLDTGTSFGGSSPFGSTTNPGSPGLVG